MSTGVDTIGPIVSIRVLVIVLGSDLNCASKFRSIFFVEYFF